MGDKVFFMCYTVIMNTKSQAIISVVGSDRVGIIARVSAMLSEYKINIVDITQTVLSGNFVMMMMADIEHSLIPLDELRKKFDALGEEMNVGIHIMHEKVFSAMHRI
ncbi:MAG: ACT domain-containing protein [Spirochaetales bacterium]